MEAEIRAQIPGIDPVVSEYSAGYLNHASQAYSAEGDPLSDAAAAVTALLLSASGDLSSQNELTIQNLVEKFVSKLASQSGVDGERRQQAPSARKLDQTIQVGSARNISSTLGLTGGVNLEHTGRQIESRVDKKKLEKAERKLRAKQDKKEFKNVEYEASKLLEQPDDAQPHEVQHGPLWCRP